MMIEYFSKLWKLGEDAVRSIREQGMIQTLDSGVWMIVNYLRSTFYQYDGLEFGLQEVVLWPWNIDVWQRNGRVVSELNKIGVGEDDIILDVGAGGDGIWKILQYTELDVRATIQLDIDKEIVQKTDRGIPVVGDGCRLPLRTNSVDVAVSVDSLEHVPSELRDSYISEMKRVSKSHVILHFPITSARTNKFVGERSDKRFQDWHERTKGHPEPNTQEHLNAGYMTVEELSEHFPPAAIKGVQNERVWITHMKLSRMPLIRIFTGLIYFLVLRHYELDPPHHACFVVHEVDESERDMEM